MKLKLYKGNVSVVGPELGILAVSPGSRLFTMGESYDQKDAAGFIRILGLPARSRAVLRNDREREGRQRQMKMWSGRFPSAAQSGVRKWQRSFPFDKRLLPRDRGQLAHAAALAKLGVFIGGVKHIVDVLLALEQIAREARPTLSTTAKLKTSITLLSAAGGAHRRSGIQASYRTQPQ